MPEVKEFSNEFKFGFEDGKRWIQGDVSLGKGIVVYVDSRKGIGIDKILDRLHKFVTYQATKVNFPSYSNEDIIQEIRILALEAIPKYDISKKANMITFLQNHIKNRIINLCKFVSEKRRRATYYSAGACKIKCPNCKAFTKVYEGVENYTCKTCYKTAPSDDPGWRRYNLPVVPILFSDIDGMIENNSDDNVSSFVEILSDGNEDLAFVGGARMPLEDKVQKKVDFLSIYNKLDYTNKNIIQMVAEGYTYKDIAKKVGISEKAAYARASKIIKNS